MSSATPGWYPVEGDNRLRWWDGRAWTEHFHEQPSPTATTGGTARAAAAPVTGARPFQDDAVWSATGKSVAGGAGRYWLTPQDIFVEKGGLSQQVPVAGVTDVDVRQTMTQKARGVFTVSVHVNRGDRIEIVSLDDIPDGRLAQAIINSTAHEARLASQRQQTTHADQGGAPMQSPAQSPVQSPVQSPFQSPVQSPVQQVPVPGPAQQPAPDAGRDSTEHLRKLGELRDAGILTDEEFAAKQAQILGRLQW